MVFKFACYYLKDRNKLNLLDPYFERRKWRSTHGWHIEGKQKGSRLSLHSQKWVQLMISAKVEVRKFHF